VLLSAVKTAGLSILIMEIYIKKTLLKAYYDKGLYKGPVVFILIFNAFIVWET
jgi:hypothetical protein